MSGNGKHQTDLPNRDVVKGPKDNWFRKLLRIPRLSEWIAMAFAVIAALAGLVEHFTTKPDIRDLVLVSLVASALLGLLLVTYILADLLYALVTKDECQRDEIDDLRRKLGDANGQIDRLKEADGRRAKCFADAAEKKASFHLDVLSVLSAGNSEHGFGLIRDGTN